MASGASSLKVVRAELFATMSETQQNLERFLEERDSGTLLQRSVHSLQQIKGILSLVGLAGAEMLAQEMQTLAMSVPADADAQYNDRLSAINTGLLVLRSYLEQLEANWVEMPELLLPAINQLRHAGGRSRLPESYFFSARLCVERPSRPAVRQLPDPKVVLARQRHLYQLALLSVIREQNVQKALDAMKRLVLQMDITDPTAPDTILYWVSAAALESFIDGKLLLNTERKLLFSRLEREIRQHLDNASYVPSRGLIKDMLYLITLAQSSGPLASQVREAANLLSLPFTDQLLADEYRRMSGPDANVLRSLSTAIREELVSVKETVDLIGRQTVSAEAFSNLPKVIDKLEKTLVMVGLNGASVPLKRQLKVMSNWQQPSDVKPEELSKLADSIIYIEGMVASLEHGLRHMDKVSELAEGEVYPSHQLTEARIVIKGEAINGLLQTKRAITLYCEAEGDTSHLKNVSDTLTMVRGGLWFIDELRAAELVQSCADYIENNMLGAEKMPEQASLEALADVLTSLEYYLEGGSIVRNGEQSPLDRASSRLESLDRTVADAVAN